MSATSRLEWVRAQDRLWELENQMADLKSRHNEQRLSEKLAWQKFRDAHTEVECTRVYKPTTGRGYSTTYLEDPYCSHHNSAPPKKIEREIVRWDPSPASTPPRKRLPSAKSRVQAKLKALESPARTADASLRHNDFHHKNDRWASETKYSVFSPGRFPITPLYDDAYDCDLDLLVRPSLRSLRSRSLSRSLPRSESRRRSLSNARSPHRPLTPSYMQNVHVPTFKQPLPACYDRPGEWVDYYCDRVRRRLSAAFDDLYGVY
eukprot:gnl/Hemi2/17601_TR5808_c0_g1_i1.p1 gnl/Hemi2/17601_TR5808_c0_g1~~gnl/Hemi2/17601_TR5808_c0_g1_i1.p1  ORF type:complete len:262 (-),score=50.36 gnl/Hemi2/17601_TR5808_c0_g1_i1:289-1074(-)